ncbi:hypothetical protein CONPUDRAFT_85699 [Coniophora puteana RWD-64-598 SS2]|uniref:Uncharacterized protein n=1 Tax=Coniophora puteana (strain RWD-64-598) TaxID=741705 RepID=A0A5M3M6P3_CONPW|nr:uncharacterized protein CONPUDRAFT_85699 [Coniophora puteana RWD-64-598 SS2]EIW75032.1 hypothetical protein CONPUDRAFT_85699 [Coniophora puteana RWD-64-598 SS2]
MHQRHAPVPPGPAFRFPLHPFLDPHIIPSHHRLETHLYSTIVLRHAGHTARFLACLHQRTQYRAFAASRIASLCISQRVPLSLAQHVLSLCTGTSNVALWVAPNTDAPKVLEPLLDKMPLRRMSVNLSTLLVHPGASGGGGEGGTAVGDEGGAEVKRPYGLATHPLFARLSHLDIVNHWALWTSTLGLERLPNLTHVSFRFWARGNVGAALRLLLGECERLEVLVLLSDKVVVPMAQKYLESEGVCDPRVVVMLYTSDAESWEELQRGGMGAWEKAERIVRWRRRTGAGPYTLPEDA